MTKNLKIFINNAGNFYLQESDVNNNIKSVKGVSSEEYEKFKEDNIEEIECPERYNVEIIPVSLEQRNINFNNKRNRLFAETKWTFERYQETSNEEDWQPWKDYRQTLRDMPQQEGFDVTNPDWPVKPE